jgi:hypothetical protein
MKFEGIEIRDMPKLESPFAREMNAKGEYVVTPKITEGYGWVFTDDEVLATEKLDGTDISIVIKNRQIVAVYNRTHDLPFFEKGKYHVFHGILNALEKGYITIDNEGQFFGELIGPKVNGNPLKLDDHIWLPFQEYVWPHLAYKSFNKYPKSFDGISKWFKEDLFSLYYRKVHAGAKEPAEGIVFVKPSTGQMAKLRRDMFDWYAGQRHKEI